VIISVAVFGVTGAGLGTLPGSEVVTIAGLLLYLYVAEPLLSHITSLGSWTLTCRAWPLTGSPRPARRACGCGRPGKVGWC
jgi:hypothetical protein